MQQTKKSCSLTLLIQAAFFLIGIFPVLHYIYTLPGVDQEGNAVVNTFIKQFSLYSAIFSEPFKQYYGFFLACAVLLGAALMLFSVLGLFSFRFPEGLCKHLAAAQWVCFGVPVWFAETAGVILFVLLAVNFAQLMLFEHYEQKSTALKIFNVVQWILVLLFWIMLMLVGFGFFPLA